MQNEAFDDSRIFLQTLFNMKEIIFALGPDADKDDANILIDQFKNNTIFFSSMFTNLFEDEESAIKYMQTREVKSSVWACVVINDIDVEHNDYSITIRMDPWSVPSTRQIADRYAAGDIVYYKQYLYSGFTSLTDLFQRHQLQFVNQHTEVPLAKRLYEVSLPRDHKVDNIFYIQFNEIVSATLTVACIAHICGLVKWFELFVLY